MPNEADIGRLMVRYDADITRLEQKLDRAVQRNAQAMRRIEQDVSRTNIAGAMERAFSNVHADAASRVIGRATDSLGVLGGAMTALGPASLAAGAAITAMVGAIHQAVRTAEWAEELGDVAAQLHLTTTQVQELDFAATAAGAPVEAMRTTLVGLQQAMGAAMGANDRAGRRFRAIFEELGISAEQLRGMRDVTQLLPLIAAGLQRLDPSRAARIGELLRINPEILHELEQGRDHIEELIASARRYGVVMDEDMVRRSSEAADAMRTAAAVMNAELRVAFAELTPVITAGATAFVQAIQAINGFIQSCRDALAPIADLMRAIQSIRLPAHLQGFADLAGWLRGMNPGDVLMGPLGGILGPIERASRGGRRRRETAELAVGNVEAFFNMANAAAGINGLPRYGSGGGGSTGGGRTSRSRAGGGRASSSEVRVSPGGAPISAADEFIRDVGTANIIGLSDEEFRTAFAMWLDLRRDGAAANISLSGFTSTVDAGQALFDRIEEHRTQLREQWADIIEGGLNAAIHGGWRGLAEYMAQTLQRALMQSISNSLANALVPSGLGGGGIGGLIRGAVGLLTGNPVLAATEVVGTIPLPTHAHASGTMAAPGGLSWVGERGPELVNLPKGSQVFPAHLSRALALDGMRSTVSNVTINLQADGAVLGNELVSTLMQLGEARVAAAEANLRVSIPADLARRNMRRLS